MIGPADGPGEESFDFMLCTSEWFGSNMKDDIAIGRHHLFVKEFSYARLEKFVRDYCTRCDGNSWQEVAEKLGRLGHWEFDGYVPHSPPSLQ